MRPSARLAATACFLSLIVFALDSRLGFHDLRDSPADLDLPNEDVQGLVQDLKAKAAQEKTVADGQAVGGVAPQCVWMDALRIEEEYRFLYRGSRTSPEKIFKRGFISGAEKERKKLKKAKDADLKNLAEHMHSSASRSDPYISTSESAVVAEAFAGWIYLIHTNRGVRTTAQLPKAGKEAARLAQDYEFEKEVAVPGHIPTEEIVGAWPWKDRPLHPENRKRDVWPVITKYGGAFIKNPNYSGPIQIAGDICPPSLQ